MISVVGYSVRLYFEIVFCLNFKIVKIFVNVDFFKDLFIKINFIKNGKFFLVEFIYSWFFLRCYICKKWGYLEKVCVMNKKDGVGMIEQILKNTVNFKGEELVEKIEINKKVAKETGNEEWVDLGNNSSSLIKRVLKYG